MNNADFAKLAFLDAADPFFATCDGVVAPINHHVELPDRESCAGTAPRDALLPTLISGELRVLDTRQVIART